MKPLAICTAAAVLLVPVAMRAQAPTTVAERQHAWEVHRQLGRVSPFADLEWRAVGPKMAGGRIEAIAVAPDNPATIYAGGAGNLWKTVNNGITWTPIFDHEDAFAIGDVAVAPSDPNIVWVGTGEVQPRYDGYAFSGTGVFKSTDAGATWQNMGLRDTQHVPKILIDPKDPNVVYVAAMGHQWSPNEERGVFKTADGGRTWKKVLYVDDSTGVIDMAMDPSDPRIVYAGAWHLPAGPQSAIYRTTDAGVTWKKLTNGLPAGPLGRMGLDVSSSNPSVVYAFIDDEAPFAGTSPFPDRHVVGAELYRSDDRGQSWRKVNAYDLYGVFTIYGWKFCDVRVSPDNPDDVYILGNRGYHSTDGGRTFRPFGEDILRLLDTEGKVLHLDQHEIWIDPRNPNRVLIGNDGGVFMSYDRAHTWLHLNDLPISQFYAVATDMQQPFTIYGGTQDDAAVYGPGDVPLADVAADLWHHVYLDRWTGGDSFVTLPDPTDPHIVYYEHQNGDLRRMDITGPSVQTSQATDIRPRAPKGEPEWRFGWYMPYVISHDDPRTLYAGGNKLLKSTDRGDHWHAISPDLSLPAGGERAVVPYGTITMIGESPVRHGLLYVGTEGGTVWRTQDDGGAWTNVSAGLPSKWVTRVVASQWEPGTIYVSLSGYRTDDFRPYVFVSTDFGATWRSISGNLPSECVNVVREDPRNRDVLYAGTDLGVYASLDRGSTWVSLASTLPSTPVEDLVIHPRDDEIVIGTHGRSVFVLDARPIQGWKQAATTGLHAFALRPMAVRNADDVEPTRARAEERILFYLQQAQAVTVTISDAQHRTVRQSRSDGRAGLNVVIWDGRIDAPAARNGQPQGRYPRPGTYMVRIAAGSLAESVPLVVTRYDRRY
ncbi:MAG TPA: hypothetical protein VFX12_07545 [Vicinamibacterales bacterium]|nr:hypothetical protein [Vicinamibacterales bacterium]